MILPLVTFASVGVQQAPPDFLLDEMVKTAQAADFFPSKGNTVSSPANLLMVTLMVAQAADEPSRLSILNSLEPRLTMPVGQDLFHELLRGEDGETTFMARAVWSRSTPPTNLVDGFREVYGAEVGRMPSQEAANDWARRNTKDMIKSFPVSVDQSKVIFASALAYINQWRGGVKRSIDVPFRFASGVQDIKGFQTQTTERTIGRVSVFSLPYANGDRMLILLSNNSTPTPNIIRDWGTPQWKEALYGRGSVMSPEEVILKMPNFEFNTKNDLVPAWVNRGRPGSVNFPGFASGRNPFFFVEAAFIKVDEKGTKAASVAAAGGGFGFGAPQPRTVVVDRPFVYAITRPGYPLPLFIGTVNEPAYDN